MWIGLVSWTATIETVDCNNCQVKEGNEACSSERGEQQQWCTKGLNVDGPFVGCYPFNTRFIS